MLRIVFASHTPMTSTFVVGSHHLAREFARMGHRVAHISTPVSILHACLTGRADVRARFGLWSSGGRWREQGLFEYVPFRLVPWEIAGRLAIKPNRQLTCMPSIEGVLRRNGFDAVDLLFVDQPKMLGLETSLAPARMIYRATDLYAAMDRDPAISDAEEAIARKADLVVGTSEPVVAEIRRRVPKQMYMVLENGVDVSQFSTARESPPEYEAIPAPRAVYAGALDERFDFDLVALVAQKLPNLNLILIGPIGRKARLMKISGAKNIFTLGARPYQELPGYFQHAQVGLLPFSSHPANTGRSPMKLYEYGAAGLPVVAVDTSELRRRREPFVLLASTPEDFADAIRTVIDKHGWTRLRDEAVNASAGMEWGAIAKRLLERASSLPNA